MKAIEQYYCAVQAVFQVYFLCVQRLLTEGIYMAQLLKHYTTRTIFDPLTPFRIVHFLMSKTESMPILTDTENSF